MRGGSPVLEQTPEAGVGAGQAKGRRQHPRLEGEGAGHGTCVALRPTLGTAGFLGHICDVCSWDSR